MDNNVRDIRNYRFSVTSDWIDANSYILYQYMYFLFYFNVMGIAIFTKIIISL